MLALTQENFDETINKEELAVVDFWAEWCAPCKVFGKVCAEVASSHPEVKFYSVDIEAEHELASDFQIRSIPFVMILRQGVAVFAESGALTAAALTDLIKQAKALDIEKIKQNIAAQDEET